MPDLSKWKMKEYRVNNMAAWGYELHESDDSRANRSSSLKVNSHRRRVQYSKSRTPRRFLGGGWLLYVCTFRTRYAIGTIDAPITSTTTTTAVVGDPAAFGPARLGPVGA